RLARTLENGDVDVRVAVDRDPHVGQFTVHVVVDGIEPGALERDAEDALGGAVEAQVGEGVAVVRKCKGIRHGRSVFSGPPAARNSVCRVDTAPATGPHLPEPRTCAMCGVIREDVAE